VIRDALRVLGIGDKFLSSRMLKVVRSGIALDNTNERGKRILSNNEAKTVLKGFELNARGKGHPLKMKLLESINVVR
jgi:hypothetical protein